MKGLKLLTDIGPVIVFFLAYKANNNLINATIYLLAASVIAMAISYFVEKKIAFVPLLSIVILAIFGGITIFTGKSTFIKIKPTIINLLFASILFGGAFFKKGLLKNILGESIKLTDELWIKLSVRWGCFFLLLAVLNEIIWRNFPEDIWVKYKVFGMVPLTILFTISQIPFLTKHKIEDK